tara:strand:- start:230 stop:1828 length:1599 start_codon:yes stop_codon:yes gene_type:complete
MAVLLRRSDQIPPSDAYDSWLTVTGTEADLPRQSRLPDLSRRLQHSFDRTRDNWLSIAKRVGEYPDGSLSHTAACAAYINDFGLMLGWTELIRDLAAAADTMLVVCDDPWLYRHLETLTGIDAGERPLLLPVVFKMALRGVAARTRVALRLIYAAITLRPGRAVCRRAQSALIVYGHPRSDANGNDAYFGSLLRELPSLGRALHTDCMPARARALCRDGRTFSLHGWGNPAFAVGLIFLRWRLPGESESHENQWLLKRATTHENSGGSLAMTKWQTHCQDRWLAACRPVAISWPWENHPWERHLCRTASRMGILRAGYQHAVVGRHQFNFSPASNPDDGYSLPDIIMCNGPAYRKQLADLGFDMEKLRLGGAFRVSKTTSAYHDPAGPVYIALSSIEAVTRQMLEAVSALTCSRVTFVAKDHPLYPMTIPESPQLRRTDKTIPESGGLSAVIYSTGTTGLEGLLAGVPTIRFLPADRIAPDILPDDLAVPERTCEELQEALLDLKQPSPLNWADVMAPIDMASWRAVLAPES